MPVSEFCHPMGKWVSDYLFLHQFPSGIRWQLLLEDSKALALATLHVPGGRVCSGTTEILIEMCKSWYLEIRPVTHASGHFKWAWDPNWTNHDASFFLDWKQAHGLGGINQNASLSFSIWYLWSQGARRSWIQVSFNLPCGEALYCEGIRTTGENQRR